MRLDIFEVQSCCYFISLRTGTKIIGFISLLGCLLASILTVLEILVVAKVHKYVDDLLVLDLLAQTIQMVTSVFLLLGAYQEKPKLIPPWLVSTLVSAVLEVIFMPSLVARIVIIDKYENTFVEWLIATLLLVVDDIYGLLVVFSYYLKLTPQGQNN